MPFAAMESLIPEKPVVWRVSNVPPAPSATKIPAAVLTPHFVPMGLRIPVNNAVMTIFRCVPPGRNVASVFAFVPLERVKQKQNQKQKQKLRRKQNQKQKQRRKQNQKPRPKQRRKLKRKQRQKLKRKQKQNQKPRPKQRRNQKPKQRRKLKQKLKRRRKLKQKPKQRRKLKQKPKQRRKQKLKLKQRRKLKQKLKQRRKLKQKLKQRRKLKQKLKRRVRYAQRELSVVCWINPAIVHRELAIGAVPIPVAVEFHNNLQNVRQEVFVRIPNFASGPSRPLSARVLRERFVAELDARRIQTVMMEICVRMINVIFRQGNVRTPLSMTERIAGGATVRSSKE